MKKNILLVSVFTLLNIFLISVLKYDDVQIHINNISNKLYTKNVRYIIDNDINKYLNIDEDHIRVFLEINESIRLILNNSDFNPNINEGRFFYDNEIVNKAIIGTDYLEKIKIINGKKILTLFDTEFEVIGIIGEKFKSKVDSLIFIKSSDVNFLNNISGLNNKFKVAIDGNSNFKINQYIKEIKLMSNDINLIKKEKVNIYKNIDAEFFQILILVLSSFLLISSISATIIHYFNQNKQLMQLQYLLGQSKKDICIFFIRELSSFILVSDLLAIPIVKIVKLDMKNFIIILLFLLIYSITILIYLLNTKFKNIVKRGTKNA